MKTLMYKYDEFGAYLITLVSEEDISYWQNKGYKMKRNPNKCKYCGRDITNLKDWETKYGCKWCDGTDNDVLFKK